MLSYRKHQTHKRFEEKEIHLSYNSGKTGKNPYDPSRVITRQSMAYYHINLSQL